MSKIRIPGANAGPHTHASALLKAASLLGLALGCQTNAVAAVPDDTAATHETSVSNQIKAPAPSNQIKGEAVSDVAASNHQKITAPNAWNKPLAAGAATQNKWNTSNQIKQPAVTANKPTAPAAPPARAARVEINPQPLPPKVTAPKVP
jgi:hypothetical protein